MVRGQDNLQHIDNEILMLGYHLRRIAMQYDQCMQFAQQLAPDGARGHAGALTVSDANAIDKLLLRLSDNVLASQQCMLHLRAAHPPAFS